MKIEWTEETPRKIQRYPGADYPKENPDLEDVLTSERCRSCRGDFPDPADRLL